MIILKGLLLLTALVLIIVNSVLRSRKEAKLKRQLKYAQASLVRAQNFRHKLRATVAAGRDDRMKLQKGIKRLMNCIQWLAVDGTNEQCGKFFDLAQDDSRHDSLVVALEYYDDLRANRPGKPKPKPQVPKECDDRIHYQDLHHQCIEQYFKDNPAAKAANDSLSTPFTHEEVWNRLLSEEQRLDILSTLPEDSTTAVKITDKLVTIKGDAEIC
jgi:hypothetical protein